MVGARGGATGNVALKQSVRMRSTKPLESVDVAPVFERLKTQAVFLQDDVGRYSNSDDQVAE